MGRNRTKTKAEKRRSAYRRRQRHRVVPLPVVMLGEGISIVPAKILAVDDPLAYIDALIEGLGQKIV